MQQSDLFKRLGYPLHADLVYKALCDSKDPLSVSAIGLAIKMPRQTVYRCLSPLLRDQIVIQQLIGKRKFYTSGSPHTLKRAMKLTEKNTRALLTKQIKVREKDVHGNIRFLHGPVGIRVAFDDVVEHIGQGETFFRYTSEHDLTKVNRYLARDYRQKRDQKKLERQVISNATSGKQKISRLERFIKFIPSEADQFEHNIIQLVYGKRMSIIDLDNEEVTIIENQRLADFQKAIFKLLYKRL